MQIQDHIMLSPILPFLPSSRWRFWMYMRICGDATLCFPIGIYGASDNHFRPCFHIVKATYPYPKGLVSYLNAMSPCVLCVPNKAVLAYRIALRPGSKAITDGNCRQVVPEQLGSYVNSENYLINNPRHVRDVFLFVCIETKVVNTLYHSDWT
jgi:hypothetical protein